jgi:DNA-binding response OmpR family regulator
MREPVLLSIASTSALPHVLAIDDSATVCRIIEMHLRSAGFTVQSFADGVAALQWLARSRAALPPLIYLDIEMPRMDGYEVARALHARADFAQTTLVLLSARDGVGDRLKGRLAGAKMYITRPFRAQDILATTRFYLAAQAEPSLSITSLSAG